MSFFEFPHTRTYDSDLGWLIRHVKELIDGYGSLDIWRAEHETEYKDLKDLVDTLVNNLMEVIKPWDGTVAYKIYTIVEYGGDNYIAIQDVPAGILITDTAYWQQANTVVQQINAIADITSEMGHFIADGMIPTLTGAYMGDFMIETAYPQGMCKANGKIYTLSAYDNTANECVLRIFDIASNAEVGSPQVIMAGHGNGITYCPDSNSYYIAPTWDRTGGTPVLWPVYLVYNHDFSSYRIVNVPKPLQNIAYDNKTGKLYALDYDWDLNEIDPATDTYTFVENIGYAFNLDPDQLVFNQVFAIYDDEWAMGDPHNFIRCGHLGETWYKDYFAAHIDGSNYKHLGEIEGMNYDEDGNLIAMFTTGLINDYYCGIITQLSARIPMETGAAHQTYKDTPTLGLSDVTQAAFKLATNSIRSLRQLPMLNREAYRVTISGTVEEPGDNLRLIHPLTLTIKSGATLKCGRIQVSSIFLAVNGSGTIELDPDATSVFYTEAGAQIVLDGSIVLDTAGDIDVVKTNSGAGSGVNLIILSKYTSAGSHTLTLFGGLPYTTGHFIRDQKTPLQILTGYKTVPIAAGSDYGEVTVTFDIPFKEIPVVVASLSSTSTVHNNITTPAIVSQTKNDFTIRAWRQVGAPNTQAINPVINWTAMLRGL